MQRKRVLLLSIIGSGHYAFNLPNMLLWKVTWPIVLASFPDCVGGLGMRLLLCSLTCPSMVDIMLLTQLWSLRNLTQYTIREQFLSKLCSLTWPSMLDIIGIALIFKCLQRMARASPSLSESEQTRTSHESSHLSTLAAVPFQLVWFWTEHFFLPSWLGVTHSTELTFES